MRKFDSCRGHSLPRRNVLAAPVGQAAIAEAATAAGLPELGASIGQVDATSDDDLDQLIARSDNEIYAFKGRRAAA